MLLLYVYVMDNVYFCRLQQCCCGIVIRIVDKIRLFRQKSMRYFTNILRWISSQEHLYFLFGLLFIIPNCVFLFTEPLPVPVGLASIAVSYTHLDVYKRQVYLCRLGGLAFCLTILP